MKQIITDRSIKFFGLGALVLVALWGSFVLAEVTSEVLPEETIEAGISQSSFRFFTGSDTTFDAKPSAKQNEKIELPKAGSFFRLKLLLSVSGDGLAKNEGEFKLQFAEKVGECDADFSGENYQDVTNNSAISFVKSSLLSDDELLIATKHDPINKAVSIRNQSFKEENEFSNNISLIAEGESGKWEFSLKDTGARNSTSYCFRVVKQSGEPLDGYLHIPEIKTRVPILIDIVDTNRNYDEYSKKSFSSIIITDTQGVITKQGGIRLSLGKSSKSVVWNTSESKIKFSGNAKRKASDKITYEDANKTLFIPINSDFERGDTLTVSGLRFESPDNDYSVDISKKDFTLESGIPVLFLEVAQTQVNTEEGFAKGFDNKYSKGELDAFEKVSVVPEEFFEQDKTEFKTDETISLKIVEEVDVTVSSSKKIPRKELIEQGADLLKNSLSADQNSNREDGLPNVKKLPEGELEIISIEVLDISGLPTELEAELVTENSESKVEVIKKDSYRPGEYTVRTLVLKNGVVYEIEQSFTLGVLAINTDKDIYENGDSAYLQIASLDSYGHTLCDTNLKLTITSPSGAVEVLSTAGGEIVYSFATCGYNNYTHNPDYYAHYDFSGSGTYNLRLENLDNGYFVEDTIKVSGQNTFEIERESATRLNPFLNNAYRMTLKVHSRNNFEGVITEKLPRGFVVAEKEGQDFEVARNDDGTTTILWNKSINDIEPLILEYEYYGPQISPEFFTLGPVVINSSEGGILQEVYEENNLWQLASDDACVSAGTGNWNADATWSSCHEGTGAPYPTTGDSVTITSGAAHTVTLNISGVTIASMQIGACNNDGGLTHTNSNTLSVTGDVTLIQGTTNSDDCVWNIGAGTGTVGGNVTFTHTQTTDSRIAQITLTTGTLDINGNLIIGAGDDVNKIIDMSGGQADLNLAGTNADAANGCLLSGSSGSVFNYDSSTVAQTVNMFGTTCGSSGYHDLHLNNTHASGVTLGAAVTTSNVTNDVRVQSGTLHNGGFALAGSTGDTFEVVNGASFKMTGTGFPTGYQTVTLGASSNVYYNIDGNGTVLAQTYGNLYIEPTVTTSRVYGGSAFTAAGIFKINPNCSACNAGFGFAMAGDVTVTGTTTVTSSGGGNIDPTLDLHPSTTSYNLMTGHLDIQNGSGFASVDGTGATSIISLTGTETGGTLFTLNGNFTAGSTEVIMMPNADVNLTSGTFTGNNAFNKLTLSPVLITTNRTYTFGSGVASTTGDFTINPTELAAGTPNLTVNLGAWLDVTGATSITASNSATSKLDTRPSGADHNLNSGTLNIGTAGTLDAGSSASVITLTGTSGTLFTRSGSFIAGSSEVIMNPNADVTLLSGNFNSTNAFYKLTLSPTLASSGKEYTMGSSYASTTSDFVINPTAGSALNLTVYAEGGIFEVASTATTTIKASGSATSCLCLDKPLVGYGNLISGHIDVQSGGTLDTDDGSSVITLTGTAGILFTNSGTLSLAGGGSAVIFNPDANVTLTSGTFSGIHNFYNLTISPTLSGSGKTYTFGSGDVSVLNNLDINPDASSALNLDVDLGSALTVSGATSIGRTGSATSNLDTTSSDHSATFAIVDIETGGTLTANNSTITISGGGVGAALTRSGTFSAGSSTVQFVAFANDNLTSGTFTGSNAFYNLDLVPKLKTVDVIYTFGSGIIEVGNNFTIDPSTTGVGDQLTVRMGANITTVGLTTIKGTGVAFSVLDTRPSSTDHNLTTGRLLLVSGSTLDAGGSSSVITLNATSSTLFSRSGTFTQGTSVVSVTSVSGSPTLLSSATTFHILDINSTATVINAGAAITMSSADASNSLSVTNGVLADGGNQIVGTANGAIAVEAGATLKLGSAGTATTFPTNYIFSGISLDPASTIVYNAGVAQNILDTAGYGNIQLSSSSGTPTKTALGSLTISGSLTIDANNTMVTSSGIRLGGNYTNNGTFSSTSQLRLTGSSQQTLTGNMTGSSAFSELLLTNNSGTNPSDCEITGYVPSVVFSGSASATDFNILTANTRVSFNNGSTYTFTNINWNANPIYFRNSAASGTWNLNVSGTQTAVSHVNVSRSDASPGDVIDASDGTNTDCNNNTDWSFVTNSAPAITNMYLNGGVDLILNESTFKWATTSFLITDAQYCSTLSSVTAKIYLASTSPNYGTTCSENDLNCYVAQSCTATTTGNTCGSGDTTVEYDCEFKVWYIAHATDSGAPWETSIWSAAATATDSGALTGTATSSTPSAGIDIVTLRAIDVTGTIAYGPLAPNSDTGSTNQTVTVTNTGNVESDLEVSGTSMTCGGCSISTPILATLQQFLINTFTYGAGTALSGTPQNFNIDLPSATATTTPSADNTYWGLGVTDAAAGAYTGTNTLTPISPI